VTYVSILKDLLAPTGPVVVTTDETDRRLITLLQEDGRAPFAALASRLGLSPSATRARLVRLLDGRAVQVGALIRRAAQDRENAMGIGLLARGDASGLASALVAVPEVEFLARCLGRFDFLLTLRADTKVALGRAADEIRSRPDVERIEAWTHMDVVKETYQDPE